MRSSAYTADDLAAAIAWAAERRTGAIIAHRTVALASVLRPPESFEGCATLADVAARFGIPLRTLQAIRRDLRRFGLVPPAVIARARRLHGTRRGGLAKAEEDFARLAQDLEAAPDAETADAIRAQLEDVRRKVDFLNAVNQTAGGHTSLEAEAEAGREIASRESGFCVSKGLADSGDAD